ncbi:MAG: glycosyltransferase family 2 protein [Geminicoccaceae bacterium]|nr:glycosyltransferase family 2 protein [Geminicoccaceae bacterium]
MEGRRPAGPDTCRPGDAARAVAELAIVVPTYQERGNLERLVAAIAAALEGVAFEIVLVDDSSPDGTARAARAMARRDPRIRVIERLHRRGLASACVEGMLATSAPYLAVMDADLQHDERLLPAMLSALRAGNVDLVIGSRYAPGGGTGAWDRRRVRISRAGTRLARLVLGAGVSDPLSGFFMLDRSLLDRTARRLSSNGFKILADLILSAEPRPRLVELAYVMRTRLEGASKLDTVAVLDLLLLLAHKSLGRLLPPRFLRFLAAGTVGACVHVAVLAALHLGSVVGFAAAQASAAGAAMTVNFAVNNRLTYRERRLRGWAELRGLLLFYAVSVAGAFANVATADALFHLGLAWYAAGAAGAAVGAVWNFATSSALVWRSAQRAVPRSVRARSVVSAAPAGEGVCG